MNIHEPATLITDGLLAGLGGVLAWKLHRRMPTENPAARWWILALFSMSISALAGGGYHGFAPNFSPEFAAIWWKSVLILVCAIGFCMGVSLVREIAPSNRQRGWNGIVIAKFLLAVTAMIICPKFFVAMLDYGLAMIAWALAAMLVRRKWSGWMLGAVGLSMIAAWVQQNRWGISIHLNHNDVYHLIQALTLVGFYRVGGLLGRVRTPPQGPTLGEKPTTDEQDDE